MKLKPMFIAPLAIIGLLVAFGATGFFPALLFADVNLSGDFAGFHDYTGQNVFIQKNDTVRIVPYGYNLDLDSTGWLSIKATNIYVLGVIDGRGRGYGGGGGGGGGTSGSVGYGGGDNGPFEGQRGADAVSGAGGDGGDGGGLQGYTGQDGQLNKGGKGGQGAGPFGGFGGLGGDPNGDGYNGHRGGYRMFEINGDTTSTLAVFMGSGGGGGGGGGGGYRTNGGNGGVGGVEGGMGASNYQLSSGGGGGGGGTGGGALTLFAYNNILVTGTILTDGAGAAELGGGYGAGGGIVLRGDTVTVAGLVKTLGGASRHGGDVTNGGTVKLACNVLVGDVPTNQAGRVLKRGMSVKEPAAAPVLNSPLRIVSCAPNPVRSAVVLRYELTRPGRVGIRIFDSAGTLVATVFDQNQANGNHAVAVNCSHLPSGVYFCRIESDRIQSDRIQSATTTITRPFTLIK